VDDVFEGARALPADRRPAYLAEKCGGDEALRQEVESLLARDARAESFFETTLLVRVDDVIAMRNLEGHSSKENPRTRARACYAKSLICSA